MVPLPVAALEAEHRQPRELAEEAAQLDFLTAQDIQAAGAIGAFRYYSGTGTRYEFDLDKAVAALAGHPLLFWMDAPGTRVELLPGEPQLMVRAGGGLVTLTLVPPLREQQGDVVVTRETATRLRIVRVRDEHRRIGAIVGDFFFGQGTPGLGQVLKRATSNNESELLFATVIVACLLGVVVFLFFGWLARLVTGRWHETTAAP